MDGLSSTPGTRGAPQLDNDDANDSGLWTQTTTPAPAAPVPATPASDEAAPPPPPPARFSRFSPTKRSTLSQGLASSLAEEIAACDPSTPTAGSVTAAPPTLSPSDESVMAVEGKAGAMADISAPTSAPETPGRTAKPEVSAPLSEKWDYFEGKAAVEGTPPASRRAMHDSSSSAAPTLSPSAPAITAPPPGSTTDAGSAREKLESLLTDALADQNAAVLELEALKLAIATTKSSYGDEQTANQAGAVSKHSRQANQLEELEAKVARARQARLTAFSAAADRLWAARAEKIACEATVAAARTARQHLQHEHVTTDGDGDGDGDGRGESDESSASALAAARHAHARAVATVHDLIATTTTTPTIGGDTPWTTTPTYPADLAGTGGGYGGAGRVEAFVGAVGLLLGSDSAVGVSASAESSASGALSSSAARVPGLAGDAEGLLKAIGGCESELELLATLDGFTETELCRQIDAVQAEVARLKEALRGLASEVAAAGAQSQATELGRMDALLRTVERDLEQRTAAERGLNDRIKRLEEEKRLALEESESSITALRSQNETMFVPAEKLNDSINDVTRLNSDVDSLQQNLVTAKEKASAAETASIELQVRLRDTRSEIDGLNQQLQREIRARSLAETKLNTLSEKALSANTQVETLSAELSALTLQRQEIERALVEKTMEGERLQKKADQALGAQIDTSITDSAAEELRAQAAEATLRSRQLEADLDDKITGLERSLRASEDLKLELGHESAKLAAEKGRADELFEQNSILLLARSALENDSADKALQLATMADREAENGTIKQFMEDKLLGYARQLEDLKTQHLNTSIDAAAAAAAATASAGPDEAQLVLLAELQEDKEQLSMQLAAAQVEVENAAARGQLEIETFQEALASSKSRIGQLDDKLETQRKALRKLQSDKELAEGLTRSQAETLAQYRADLDDALRANTQAVEDAVASAVASTASAELVKARADLKKALSHIHDLEDEIDAHHAQRPVTVASRGLELDTTDNADKVAVLTGEVEALQAELKAEQANREMVEAQLVYLKQRGDHDIEMLRNHAAIESGRLVETNNRLQNELTSNTSLAHRMAVDELGALKTENAQLRAALRSGGNGSGSGNGNGVLNSMRGPAAWQPGRVDAGARSNRRPAKNSKARRAARSPVFEVSVWQTPPADKLGLTERKFGLRVAADALALVDPATNRPVQVWPIEHVLRYGVDGDTISLDIGRISKNASGIFYFHSKAANELFNALDARCSADSA